MELNFNDIPVKITKQEILDNVIKFCTKTFTQTSCWRVGMEANVKIFSLDKNPEGKGCFH